jgi:hypothetical protein
MATTSNSGLYGVRPFYTIHSKKIVRDVDLLDYDAEVFAENYDVESDENLFWTLFDYHPSLYKPVIFDPTIAWKCGLIPLEYDGESYFSLTAGGMDLRPHLDAYQALVCKRIDPLSKYFHDKEWFKHVVGKTLMQEIDEKLKESSN